jgi:hypothetical protein
MTRQNVQISILTVLGILLHCPYCATALPVMRICSQIVFVYEIRAL